MKGRLWLCLHLLIFFFSLSSLFVKLAAKQSFFSLKWGLFYGLALLVLSCYAVLWQQIIKRMPLSTAYANKAAAILWGQLWGLLIFKEAMTAGRAAGAALIMFGIWLYTRWEAEDEKR